MKLLQRGIPPQETKAEFRCLHCKSLYEAKRSEGTYHSDQREGDYVSFTCQVCRSPIHVAWSQFK